MANRGSFAHLQWDRAEDQRVEPAPLSLDARVLPRGRSADSAADNRLIEGDNLPVMARLAEELEGQIDLIYLDPPFLTGKSYAARVGRGEDSRKPAEWETARGFTDDWSDGAGYLNMLFPRLQWMHRLLAPTGSLYLHMDWHASAYARVLLDEIFGPDRLLNEIVWIYHGPSPIRSAFNRKHDTLLVYTKSEEYTFNADAVRVPYAESTVKTFASSEKAGFGKQPDLKRGKVPEDWWYFPVVARLHSERTGYPTQKPEALLERIILASSNPGDLVADFFVGAGTTAVVAGRNNRRWLACDHTPLAIRTTHRRLLLAEEPSPFSILRDGRLRAPSLQPQITVGPDLVELTGLEGSQAPQSFPDNVILWEIDPAFDGTTFTSEQQVARPFREGRIALSIPRPTSEGGRRLAVRAADTIGDLGQLSAAIA